MFSVLLPKGVLVKFSLLANSNEDGKKVSPEGEGLSITEQRLSELPREPESGTEAKFITPFLPLPHPLRILFHCWQ